jgi:hypothetical protein
MATRAASTAPKEKNTERAVTRYSLPRGICSRRSVPSVGIDPPTALPRKNRATQSIGNVVANDAAMPKMDVKNRVALNAVLRPIRSEQVPQPTAPIIIPANIEEDKIPMRLSGSKK